MCHSIAPRNYIFVKAMSKSFLSFAKNEQKEW